MTVTTNLTNVEAIIRHLMARGFEVMISGPRVAVRAQIGDFPAHVNLQFREDRTLRVSAGMPIRVTDENRAAIAQHALELNRTGLGVACVMNGPGVAFVTQVPVEERWQVPAIAVERAFALVVDTARAALPALERIQLSGTTTA